MHQGNVWLMRSNVLSHFLTALFIVVVVVSSSSSYSSSVAIIIISISAKLRMIKCRSLFLETSFLASSQLLKSICGAAYAISPAAIGVMKSVKTFPLLCRLDLVWSARTGPKKKKRRRLHVNVQVLVCYNEIVSTGNVREQNFMSLVHGPLT